MLVALWSFPLNLPLYVLYLVFLQVALVTPSLPGPAPPAGGGVVAVLRLAGLQAAFPLLVRPGRGGHGVRSYRDDGDSLLRLRLLAPAGGNIQYFLQFSKI